MNYIELNRCKTLLAEYKPLGCNDVERYNYCLTLMKNEIYRLKADNTAHKNNGLYGDVFEILNRCPEDELIKVATQNKSDAHLIIGKGKKGIELKTNMGRADFITDSKTATYVIYQCFLPKMINGKKTEIASQIVIMTKKQFKQALKKYGELSETSDGGHIIRVNKKWFDFIQSWIIPYDRTTEYMLDDFRGIEI